MKTTTKLVLPSKLMLGLIASLSIFLAGCATAPTPSTNTKAQAPIEKRPVVVKKEQKSEPKVEAKVEAKPQPPAAVLAHAPGASATAQVQSNAVSAPVAPTVIVQSGSDKNGAPVPLIITPGSATEVTPAPGSINSSVDDGPVVVIRDSVPDAPAAIDLWERMRKGFKMKELNSPLVAEKEKYYLARPDYLQRMFSRGNRYLYFIMEEIDKRGMPMELALLPFVESAMNPVAMSSAKASGLWQFIPSTGKHYNLSQNWWVDNRRDVAKATVAALEYLQKIYTLQGDDWFLALASYNWGEGSVARAMRANAARGLPTDYVSLSMPLETKHYVPKLIALRNIVMRAKELGIVLPDAPNKPYFVTIEKSRPIDLRLAAQFAGMSVDEFVALNPAHNRPVIAASKNNQILIPAAREKQFVQAMESHAQANKTFASWQPRTLVSGESLESIAQAGGVSVAELRSANGIRSHQRILPGTRIIAPQSKVKDESAVESFVAPKVVEAVQVPAQRHVVGKKETLNSIAKRYGVSVAALRSWNGIKKTVKRGTLLVVRPGYSQTVVTHETGLRQVVANRASAPVFVPAVAKPNDDEDDEPPAKASKRSAKKGKEALKSKSAKGSKKVVASKGKSKGKALAKSGSKSKQVAKATSKKSKRA
jgi:membrane-bound lytic murein transglycosylase D